MQKKWGWGLVVHQLADGKFLDIEKVFEKKLHECLWFLSITKDIQDTDRAEIEAKQRRNGR